MTEEPLLSRLGLIPLVEADVSETTDALSLACGHPETLDLRLGLEYSLFALV